MPVLPCPLGVHCHYGEDGGTWKSVDIPFEQAMILVDRHVEFSHKSDGASAAPAQRRPGDHLNVNKGVQGGNFDNCDLLNPIFNINSQGVLFIQHYQKIRFIGKGSFGETWIVKPKNVSDSKVFIMKEIPCTEENVETGRNEINLLKSCRDERIVCYIEDFFESSKIQIIMEYCEGGDLAKFIDARRQFLDVDFIIEWVIQLTSGVCFIHKMKIIHRDLKPANIFLTSDQKLKIGDFGIARALDNTCSLASTRVGTSVYMAPEILGGEKYNTMADMWSLGIVVFEIITFKRPFHGHDCLVAIFKEKKI